MVQSKTTTVRLSTFETQSKVKPSSQRPSTQGKSDGINVVQYVGNHECSTTPPSLFEESGAMRPSGSKASLVHAIKQETGVDIVVSLTRATSEMAVIVDAMHMVRRWSFQKGETFKTIYNHFKQLLLRYIPDGTIAVHFCSDRYRGISTQSDVRELRGGRCQTR